MTVQGIKNLKERTSDVEIQGALDLAVEYKQLHEELEKWRDMKIKLVSKKTYRWLRKAATLVEISQLDAILYEMKE